jgi:hypothetical protein
MDGLSEQPAVHSASVSDLRRGVISGDAISFVNKLLAGFQPLLDDHRRGIRITTRHIDDLCAGLSSCY